MKWLVLLAFAFLGPATSWAQAVVGNNGEGVLSGDVIYLRDLYENKNHLSPYVGSNIAPQIAARSWMLSFLQNIPFEHELMLKKLSDAEAMKPGFGIFLLEALGIYYFWHSDNYVGARTPDPLTLENGNSLQVLAVRQYNGVKIFWHNYQRMSAEHQVALILHELIASYVKVVGSECHRLHRPPCTQSSTAARILTNKLFTEGAVFSKAELELIDIEWPAETLSLDKILMNVSIENKKQFFVVERSRQVFRIENALTYFSAQVCDGLTAPVTADFELIHEPFTVSLFGFDYGGYNKALRVRMATEHCQFSLRLETPYLCRESLKAAQHKIGLSQMCNR
jgi:hypothetical protein